jgi:hypothetical protein
MGKPQLTAFAALLLVAIAATPTLAAVRVAVFSFEIADPGAATDATGQISAGAFQLQQQGTPTDIRRLALATDTLRTLLLKDPQLLPIDTGALAARIADAAPLHKCNGCEADLARLAGADMSILGTVTKLTSVLIHFDITVRDTTSGAVVRSVSVDVNGDTDDSWARGPRWLYKNRLADPPLLKP